MKRTRWMRLLAVTGVMSIALVACGGGEDVGTGTDGGDATESPTDGGTEGTEVSKPAADEKLDIGYILPETGPLAFLGPPQIEGVRMAIEDINAAGGVLGQEVTLLTGDEAGDAARVKEAAARQINQGVDAIVGAAASGMSQEIIQTLSDNQIVQCSASNTSPAFSTQENADFYFRTVPPDQAVAPIIANQVIADGHQSVAILARADDYGRALGDLVAESLESSGATVAANINYDPNASTFDAEVSQAVQSGADAFVLISFDEGAQIIKGLLEEGISPEALYGGDGLFGPTLPDLVGGSIDGMTVIGAAGGTEFNQRLNERLDEENQGNLIYGGQAYDCAVIIALASQAAGSADPAEFVNNMIDVTKDGTKCETFEQCKQLLEDGENIDYEGAAGPINLDDVGDPSFGRYAIAEFQNGELVVVDSQNADLTELQSEEQES